MKINLFKRKASKFTVEEIHHTFYSEVDRLLKEAQVYRPIELNHALIDKGKSLRKMGFVNAPEAIQATMEEERISNYKNEEHEKQILIEAINYFSKYPNYKFITEDSVKKICKKYNLVYGQVSRYTGFVPKKNLRHIEEFKIDEQDECYELRRYSISGREYLVGYAQKSKAREACLQDKRLYRRDDFTDYVRLQEEKLTLEIAAPAKDFNLSESQIENFKINPKVEIPDPVVLKPVVFKERKYYLIVTAWGDESTDELVVNQRFN